MPRFPGWSHPFISSAFSSSSAPKEMMKGGRGRGRVKAKGGRGPGRQNGVRQRRSETSRGETPESSVSAQGAGRQREHSSGVRERRSETSMGETPVTSASAALEAELDRLRMHVLHASGRDPREGLHVLPPVPPTTTRPRDMAALQRQLIEMTRQRDEAVTRCKNIEHENEELHNRMLRFLELSHAFDSLQKVSNYTCRTPPPRASPYALLHLPATTAPNFTVGGAPWVASQNRTTARCSAP